MSDVTDRKERLTPGHVQLSLLWFTSGEKNRASSGPIADIDLGYQTIATGTTCGITDDQDPEDRLSLSRFSDRHASQSVRFLCQSYLLPLNQRYLSSVSYVKPDPFVLQPRLLLL